MATLAEMRAWFREETGDQSTTDAAMDRFINDGQRMMESMTGLQDSVTYTDIAITQGDTSLTVTGCRSIRKVFLVNDNNQLLELEKRRYEQVVDELPKMENADEGQPYWYVSNSSTSKSTDRELLIFPPSDDSYTIRVWGLFYMSSLSDDADTSFWSTSHPRLLVDAATVKYYNFLQNYDMANAKLHLLKQELQWIMADQSDEQSYSVRVEG